MKKYFEDACYPFRYPRRIAKEVKMTRVYIGKDGKKIVDALYAERTSHPSKLIVLDIIIGNTLEHNIHGGLCELLDGDYFMGKEKVDIHKLVEQVHCGAGIINIIEEV